MASVGCAFTPTGPSVMVLPGSGADFEHFRADDLYCRDFALRQIGGQTPGQVATDSGVASALLGAGIGAAAGAAFGGGQGAAIGAGTGLLAGTLFGSAEANQTYHGAQYSYDANYMQCMYAKGHRVPVYGNFTREFYESGDYDRGQSPGYPESRPNADIPPPPPGQPPPPPPGAPVPYQ
ncbi:MAG: YMGG-like glycine zipper-containing protein [Gammaproteobacteria bacterium]